MNPKTLFIATGILFVLLFATYSWNSSVAKSRQVGPVISMKVTQQNMETSKEISLDPEGKVTAKLTTRGGASPSTQVKTGTITSPQRIAIIGATLARYDATALASDPTPSPDVTTSHVVFLLDGKNYDLSCSLPDSACTKLANELLSDFADLLAKQQ